MSQSPVNLTGKQHPVSNVTAAANPFATRFTSAGQIPYFFSAPDELERLIAKGNGFNWQAQIVGPHGSGKSTLAQQLTRELQSQFDRIEFLIVRRFDDIQRCGDPKSSTPVSSNFQQRRSDKKTIFVIDGIERLSWLQRKLIVADCRRRGVGLLVTTHRRLMNLPVLYETSFDADRFNKILSHLGSDQYATYYPQLASDHGEDCREMLFALYDRHAAGEERHNSFKPYSLRFL